MEAPTGPRGVFGIMCSSWPRGHIYSDSIFMLKRLKMLARVFTPSSSNFLRIWISSLSCVWGISQIVWESKSYDHRGQGQYSTRTSLYSPLCAVVCIAWALERTPSTGPLLLPSCSARSSTLSLYSFQWKPQILALWARCGSSWKKDIISLFEWVFFE